MTADLDPFSGRTVPMRTENLSDVGNAARFVRQHGRELRYVTAWGRWIVWDGTHWSKDVTAEAMRRAKATVATIGGETAQIVDSIERKRVLEHALKSESERSINAMIALAECDLAIRPDELDADPWLLNAENGTLDLRNGELQPHDSADLITRLAPVRFKPEATHPVWAAFLEKMVPDADERAFLQRAVGYSLTGDTREEVLFFGHGPTAAGKSTLTGAVRAMLGDYGAVADFETFLKGRNDGGARNDLARLHGARFVVSQEVGDGRALAEGIIKWVTGKDAVLARFLYQEAFEFVPAFKLWLSANHKPRVNADDDAAWRRILLVPFTVSLPESERDPAVKETLTHDPGARAAILAWAVHGVREWRKHGLRPPDTVRRATAAYREEQDTFAPFLDDSCVLESGAWVSNQDLRTAYKAWCDANDAKPLSKDAFAARLRQQGCTPQQANDRNRTRGWSGVWLQNAPQPVADSSDGSDVSAESFSRARGREKSWNSRPQPSETSAVEKQHQQFASSNRAFDLADLPPNEPQEPPFEGSPPGRLKAGEIEGGLGEMSFTLTTEERAVLDALEGRS